MKIAVCFAVSALVVSIGLPVLAFDVDTIALYDFASAHTNAVGEGTQISNLVDGTRFTGTNVMNGHDENLTRFSADRPGKYVFERAAYGATPILTDPMSVYFGMVSGHGDQQTARRITFADLGTAISSNADWTIEFFFKCDSENKWKSGEEVWNPLLTANCGLLYNPRSGAPAEQMDFAGTPQPLNVKLPNSTLYTDVRSATYHPASIAASSYKRVEPTDSYFDDLWHHYACVYKAAERKFTIYLDQNEKWAAVDRETTNSVLTTSEPLDIGRNAIKGYISCLRVSKCARTPAAFLHASDDPKFLPDERVFHWRLDDANAAPVGTATNLYAVANPFMGQYIGLLNSAANGTVLVASGAPTPVYTNEVPNANHRFLRSGSERFDAPNAGSVYKDIKQRTDEKYFLPGNGLALKGVDHIPVDAGSFTLEFFMKFDAAGWKTRTSGTEYPRLTIFSLYNTDANGYLDFALKMEPTNSGGWLLSESIGKYMPKATFSPGYSTTTLFKDNPWHHYAIVYDEPALKIRTYIDGVQIYTITLSAPYEPLTRHGERDYQFGYGGNNHPITAVFDEIRLVRRALDPSEFLSWHTTNGGLTLFVR